MIFLADKRDIIQNAVEAQLAGVVLGTRVPIIINGRAENMIARLGSCALALLPVRNKQFSVPNVG